VQAPNSIDLLRSAAIYGPNAAGKSNLLMALRSMKEIVVKSALNRQRGDKLPVTPFKLDVKTASSPSKFEVTLISGGVRYQYGFSADQQQIYEEWLIAYPKGFPQHWFDRVWDKKKKKYNWSMGSALQGEKKLWQKSTRENALFLSTAVQLNSEQLQPVYDWFNARLRLAHVSGWSQGFSASLCQKKEKAKVLSFLKAADLDIQDISVKKEVFDPDQLPADMPETIKLMLASEMENKNLLSVKTLHKRSDGKLIAFDFDEEESHGTQKFFSFSGPWIDSLKNGYVLFIDELHDNFHPNLVKFLVQLFHNNETNPNNAQLVFTTHETSILNQEVFRRDQIWFCEKGEGRATKLYPLTDFSPRKGRENLELAYLSGRYGALPYIRPFWSSNKHELQ
jgi:AAA15 family ATPase/GTPase